MQGADRTNSIIGLSNWCFPKIEEALHCNGIFPEAITHISCLMDNTQYEHPVCNW